MFDFLTRGYSVICILLSPFIKIKKNRILFWSWGSKRYDCNPRYISDYILENYPDDFELYWCFKKGCEPKNIDKRIKVLRWGTFHYLIRALSCKFLISNTRNDIGMMLFRKRKHQKYIMTWHAGMSLKKVEKDAVQSLSKGYMKRCLYDSSIADLFISGSRFQSKLYRESYWYNGEILECGCPRNDIMFCDTDSFKKTFCEENNLDIDSILILYAPTFRMPFKIDDYSLNWDTVKDLIKGKFGKQPVLLIRLHPNIAKYSNDLSFDYNRKDIVDVTMYGDMQRLLSIADVLITDYSSSMFDFSLSNKPCFLLVRDENKYDRGTYLGLSELPFSLANTEIELREIISNFNNEEYLDKLLCFNNKIGSFERGEASAKIIDWIISQNK